MRDAVGSRIGRGVAHHERYSAVHGVPVVGTVQLGEPVGVKESHPALVPPGIQRAGAIGLLVGLCKDEVVDPEMVTEHLAHLEEDLLRGHVARKEAIHFCREGKVRLPADLVGDVREDDADLPAASSREPEHLQVVPPVRDLLPAQIGAFAGSHQVGRSITQESHTLLSYRAQEHAGERTPEDALRSRVGLAATQVHDLPLIVLDHVDDQEALVDGTEQLPVPLTGMECRLSLPASCRVVGEDPHRRGFRPPYFESVDVVPAAELIDLVFQAAGDAARSDSAVEVEPFLLDVGKQLGNAFPDGIRPSALLDESGIGLDVAPVHRPALVVEDHLDDAEALLERLRHLSVSLLADEERSFGGRPPYRR